MIRPGLKEEIEGLYELPASELPAEAHGLVDEQLQGEAILARIDGTVAVPTPVLAPGWARP